MEDFNKTHTVLENAHYASPQNKLFADTSDEFAHNNPDFMMTLSPQVRRHHNLEDMNTDTNMDSAAFTNPPTNYASHAKISARNGHKKGSVEHTPPPHQMSAVMPDAYKLPGVKQASGSKRTF